MPRGAWYYSAEADVGYVGALRTHATILTHDPLFGDFVYGGLMEKKAHALQVIPRDGLRCRFHVIRADQGLHMILERDGYAKERPIRVRNDLSQITFWLENRAEHAHMSGLRLSGLPEGGYIVQAGDRTVTSIQGGPTEQTVLLPIIEDPVIRISITKTP